MRARRREDGTPKVIKPQMLIGYLLQMSVGDESAPKGGHAADLAARAATEMANACGQRSNSYRSSTKINFVRPGETRLLSARPNGRNSCVYTCPEVSETGEISTARFPPLSVFKKTDFWRDAGTMDCHPPLALSACRRKVANGVLPLPRGNFPFEAGWS